MIGKIERIHMFYNFGINYNIIKLTVSKDDYFEIYCTYGIYPTTKQEDNNIVTFYYD
jgi:hypothetical protein